MTGESDSGTETETAILLDTGEIELLVVAGGNDGIGHGGFNMKPEDPDYADYKARFNLVKAGDWKTISRRLIDGKWVDLRSSMIGDSDGGTEIEEATLSGSGQIDVLVVPGGIDSIGHGGFVIKPEDPEYNDYKARFNLVKPGDSKMIERRLIDGKWVDLPPRPRKAQDPCEGKLI